MKVKIMTNEKDAIMNEANKLAVEIMKKAEGLSLAVLANALELCRMEVDRIIRSVKLTTSQQTLPEAIDKKEKKVKK